MKTPFSRVFFEAAEDHLKTYPDNAFTLSYNDPSYGIGESGKVRKNKAVKQKNGKILKMQPNDYKKSNWDDNPPSDLFFEQIFRTSQNQFIWRANYFSQIVGTPFKPPRRNEFENFILKYPKGWVVWDKINGRNDFNDCELAWTSFDRPTIILHYMWNGMMQGESIQYGTIQRGDKTKNEKRIHPTQKPMPINRWVYKNYLETPNSIVFDGGVGSQGSRIAAYEYGCDFIGCENNQNNFDLGNERFEKFMLLYNSQPKIF